MSIKKLPIITVNIAAALSLLLAGCDDVNKLSDKKAENIIIDALRAKDKERFEDIVIKIQGIKVNPRNDGEVTARLSIKNYKELISIGSKDTVDFKPHYKDIDGEGEAHFTHFKDKSYNLKYVTFTPANYSDKTYIIYESRDTTTSN